VHWGQALGIGRPSGTDRATDSRDRSYGQRRGSCHARGSNIPPRGNLAYPAPRQSRPGPGIVNKTIILTALEVNAGLFALPFRQPWVLDKYYKVSRVRSALVR
jgi:hypothetical protein